jgi:hypothetical protein
VLRPDRTVLVQDEFAALDRPAAVRWAMLTRVDVRIDGPGRACLTQNEQSLEFRVLEPAAAVLKIFPPHPPPSDFDAPNEGTRMIGFEVTVPAAEAQRLVVHLVPGSAAPAQVDVAPLSAW